MGDIERLRAELQAAEAQANAEGLEEFNKINLFYDYNIKWRSEFVFYASRRVSRVSLLAYEAWKKKYPECSVHWPHPKTEGMEYVLIDDKLVQVSGGTLVLIATDNRDPFSHEPKRLTDLEASALRVGIVPESLKAR